MKKYKEKSNDRSSFCYKPFSSKQKEPVDYQMKSSSSKRSVSKPGSTDFNFGSTKKRLDQDDMDVDQSLDMSPTSKLAKFRKLQENNYLKMDEIDQKDREDPHQCAIYAKLIHENLILEESRHVPSADYMSIQTDINEKMRAILVDWLVEVHLKFKLEAETLYLTVNLIDRYLEKEIVMREKL